MFRKTHGIQIVLASVLLFAGQVGPADAASCAAAAKAVVNSTGGELLSAVPAPDGDGCLVTVIVPASNGNMPRKVTRRVPAR
ncbi:hypothetical protein [Martelella mediterranea]|nr:hypothetical protein [uncultured Martelella sp.]